LPTAITPASVAYSSLCPASRVASFLARRLLVCAPLVAAIELASSGAEANTLASVDSGVGSPLIRVAAHTDVEHHILGLAERLAERLA
jgi:hypothetical protein